MSVDCAAVVELRRNPPLDDGLRAALADLWTQVSNAGGAVGFVPPVTAEDVRPIADREFDRVAVGSDDLVVAFDNSTPVGFGFLVHNTDPLLAHWAEVARLQRHPNHGGGGLGAAVLAELEDIAAGQSLERVVLSVRGGTGRERFYQSLGYEVYATLPRWLRLSDSDVRDSLVLGKRVDGRTDPARTVPMEIVRLDTELPLPGYAHAGDAGLDLRAAREVTLAPGERAVVPTGIAVALPPGHVGLVHPRSGLAARHGLALVNSPGTIDEGYRGQIQVVLVNLDPRETVTVGRGDRIAQLLVQRVEQVRLVEVDELPGSDRGSGGFGSSGR